MSILAERSSAALRDAPMSGRTRRGDRASTGDYLPANDPRAIHQEAPDVTALMERRLGVDRIDAFFESASAAVATALPDDVLVTFEITGEGGGTWTLHTEPGGVDVRSGRAMWADSVLTCSVPRFVDLVTGQIDVEKAFFDGTVRIEGDVGLLLRLYRALPKAV